jgi:hypothetical protein
VRATPRKSSSRCVAIGASVLLTVLAPAARAMATSDSFDGVRISLPSGPSLEASTGDWIRIQTTDRSWHEGLVDAITPDSLYLKKHGGLPVESVNRGLVRLMYRRGPRETTVSSVLTGGAAGFLLGLVIGAAVAGTRVSVTPRFATGSAMVDDEAGTEFWIGLGSSTVAGLLIGAIPRHQWEEIPVSTEDDR